MRFHRAFPEDEVPDPIGKTFRDAPDFNRAWLGTSRLSNIQRAGFTTLSLFLMLGGGIFIRDGVEMVLGGFPGWYLAICGLIAFYMGVWGLWRVTKDVFYKRSK